MQRALSIGKPKKKDSSGDASSPRSAPKHHFTLASLRGTQQPELSKRLYKLIKTENHTIAAYESAGKERISIASQLSEWGESTGDDSISDLSDKLGVLLSEIGEQEENFAHALDDSRAVLKQIRNTEASVQPSRDNKQKVADEIAKLKYKEPESTKLPQLEQELVRLEAQNLVAEAQLTNITRQKLKAAFDLHTAATIERAEKQLILAKHARRLLNLLDDTPIVPGDARPAFDQEAQARQVLVDAEDDLREWTAQLEPVISKSEGMGTNLMPNEDLVTSPSSVTATAGVGTTTESVVDAATQEVKTPHADKIAKEQAGEGTHLKEATESSTGTAVTEPSSAKAVEAGETSSTAATVGTAS